MGSRLDLQDLLESILGSSEVYFQPPESVRMKYPSIVFSLSGINKRVADDGTYNLIHEYTMTLMHKDPDNDIVDKLVSLPYCRFNRSFRNDNLNHYVFTIYY